MLLEVPPHIHHTLNSTLLAVEVLVPILEIVTPTFRPVGYMLYRLITFTV